MAKKRQTFDRAAAKRKAARLAKAAGKLQRREDGKQKARVEGKPKPKPKPKAKAKGARKAKE